MAVFDIHATQAEPIHLFDSSEYIHLYDTNKGTSASNTFGAVSREFTIKSYDKTSFLMLSRSYIEVSCKMVRNNTGNTAYENYVDDAGNNTNKLNDVSFVSDIRNIFSRITLKSGSQVIQDYSTGAGASSWFNVQNVVATTKEFIDTVGSNMLMVDPAKFGLPYEGEEQTGLLNDRTLMYNEIRRKGLGSKTVKCLIPLSRLFDIFRDNDKVFYGLDWEMTFYINDDSKIFVKRSEAGTGGFAIPGDPKLNWVDYGIRLNLMRVQPAPQQRAMLLKNIASKPEIKCRFETVWLDRRTFLQTQQNVSEQVALPVGALNKIFITFQRQARSTSNSLLDDSTRFDQLNLRRLSLEVNGIKIPARDIECDYQQGNDTIPYMHYMDLTNNQGAGKKPLNLMSKDNFIKHFPIYCFDLMKFPKAGSASNQGNNLVVNWEMNAPGADYQMLVFVLHDKQFKLNYSTANVIQDSI
eukprot:TRINITY_DN921_c0_g1_i4.p1 TRINITY_DN921_c0_g1~~TRINITY_DN921_c0_g1_i4.p1  ORF type:complete len:467 (-),score=15.00 TRINITY_DN921_c0_g1_i4:520-1920(-)